MDNRHRKRVKIIQELYASSFNHDGSLSDRSRQILEHSHNFDSEIKKIASKFAIDKIAKVDLAILHLSLFELIIEKKVPPKVIINEAVELAKEMGGDKSPSFINAVLGKIYETRK